MYGITKTERALFPVCENTYNMATGDRHSAAAIDAKRKPRDYDDVHRAGTERPLATTRWYGIPVRWFRGVNRSALVKQTRELETFQTFPDDDRSYTYLQLPRAVGDQYHCRELAYLSTAAACTGCTKLCSFTAPIVHFGLSIFFKRNHR